MLCTHYTVLCGKCFWRFLKQSLILANFSSYYVTWCHTIMCTRTRTYVHSGSPYIELCDAILISCGLLRWAVAIVYSFSKCTWDTTDTATAIYVCISCIIFSVFPAIWINCDCFLRKHYLERYPSMKKSYLLRRERVFQICVCNCEHCQYSIHCDEILAGIVFHFLPYTNKRWRK